MKTELTMMANQAEHKEAVKMLLQVPIARDVLIEIFLFKDHSHSKNHAIIGMSDGYRY